MITLKTSRLKAFGMNLLATNRPIIVTKSVIQVRCSCLISIKHISFSSLHYHQKTGYLWSVFVTLLIN